jgi:hypothetical protein
LREQPGNRARDDETAGRASHTFFRMREDIGLNGQSHAAAHVRCARKSPDAVGARDRDVRARARAQAARAAAGWHFDADVDGFDISSAAASDWFSQHLLTREAIPA